MLPRTDGWYAAVRPPADKPLTATWIKPATVAGRHLLLIRLNAAPPISGVSAAAERIPSTYRIPTAWKARIGSYRAASILPRTYPGGVSPVGALTIDHGALVWSTADGARPPAGLWSRMALAVPSPSDSPPTRSSGAPATRSPPPATR